MFNVTAMIITAQENIKTSYSREKKIFISKMSHLLKAYDSSTSLMVGICLIEKNHFFYCSSKLKKVLGDCCSNLIEEGWDFLYSQINSTELDSVKNKIAAFLAKPYLQNLITLKYHITNCYGKNNFIKHEIIIHQIENHLFAINYFFDITEKEQIKYGNETNSKTFNSESLNKNSLIISSREKEVLKLIGDGFSSKEIADRLFISNHTAVSHRKNLIKKFQVKNTAHLIKKASTLMTL